MYPQAGHRSSRRQKLVFWITLGVLFMAICLAGAMISIPAGGVELSGVARTARSIDPNMVGYNSDYYYMTNPWSHQKRVDAAVKARPGLLRYPGGTSSNYWDAYRSRIFRDVSTIDPADGNPASWIQTRYTINWIHNAFFWTNVTPLSDLKQLHTALKKAYGGAETIFMANMVTPGADFYSLKWQRTLDRNPGSQDWWTMMGDRYRAFRYLLDDAAKNGLPVKYVELGNEYYFGAGLTRRGKPADVEPYVAGSYDADNKFAYENIGTFPDQGSDGKDTLYLYGVVANDWASKVKQAYPGAKVCAIGAFVDKDGYARRSANWNREALAALDPTKVDALSLHLYGGARAGSLTEDEAKLGSALRSWQNFWLAGVKRSSLPKNLDLWITEFNIDDEFGKGDSLPENKGTWGNGLGNIYSLHYWLANEPRVQVVLLHELARVINGDGPSIKAHGRAYGLFTRAMIGRTRAYALWLKNVPLLKGSGGNIKGIVGWKFDTPSRSKPSSYAFVNFTGSSHTLTGLQRLTSARGGQYIQASSALNRLTDPGEITGKVNNLSRNMLRLPPYSVTVLEAPLSK